MLFSKLLPRSIAFAIMLIAGLAFVAMVVYNLGLPVAEVAHQLLLVIVLITCLIVASLALVACIRWVLACFKKGGTGKK